MGPSLRAEVAYYPLDANAIDLSGNALNGTVVGTTPSTNRFGAPQSALTFNGVSDYINCGASNIFCFQTNFTLSAWVKLNGAQPAKYVVAKYNGAASPRSYGLAFDGSSRIYGFVSSSTGSYVEASGGPSLNDSKWHSLNFVYDNSSGIQLYVDGALVTSRAAAGYAPFNNSPIPFTIGGLTNAQFFGGQIDEVKVYDRALTATEIATSFGAELDSGLIGRWSFDEGSGTTAIDSISGFNGAIVNATRIAGRIGSGALEFNGTNSYVVIGGEQSSLQLTNTNFSITWWQKWNGLTGKFQDVIAMDDGADYSGGYQMYIPNGSLSVHATSSSDAWYNIVPVSTDWTFFALTSDGTNRRLYTNGVLVATKGIVSPLKSDGNDPLVFGAIRLQNGTFDDFYKGALDEIEIYRRALSSDEVLALSKQSALFISKQPQPARIAPGDTYVLSVQAIASDGPITYQWEMNRTPIPDATSSSLTVTGTSGTNHYRVLLKSGTTQLYSDEVDVSFLSLEDALLARWNFDEDSGSIAFDSVSNRNGTIVNATRIPGKVGTGALQFNGSNSYVLVGGEQSPLQLTNTNFAITWWQRWDGPTAAIQEVVAMDDGADFSGGYHIWMTAGTPTMNLHATSQADVWNSMAQATTSWSFYALTSDGINRRIYVNGVLTGTKPIVEPLKSDGDDPFVIGAIRLQNGNFIDVFNGALDDIRIYQRSLSAAEVASLGPPPSIQITQQPVGYRVGVGETATLSVTASLQGAGGPLRYQWEANGVPIDKATNATLRVTGLSGTNNYRVVVQSDTIQQYSDEATVVTVAPTDAKLLLRLDFEETSDGTYVDSANGLLGITGTASLIPGRVGTFAADFNGSAFIRVPAAGSELELVGTSYTIAWWMKTRSPIAASVEQIFTLGNPAQNVTGYGARLEGFTTTRTLRSDHRNGVSPSIASQYRTSTNWQHVAIVYNGVTRTVFTNGVVAGTSISTSADIIGSGRDDLFIGAESQIKFSAFGALDDFRIYNYPLATDEIQALVNAPPPQTRVSISQSNGELTLTWPAADNAQYRVEYATELPAASWTPVSATLQLSGNYYQLKIPAPTTTRFYRVRQL